MKVKVNAYKIVFLTLNLLFSISLILTYNACSRVSGSFVQVSQGFGAMSSNAASAVCTPPLQQAYQSTFFPFLSQWCNSCHGTAQGSNDPNVSFQSFMAKGEALIVQKAADGHNGYTPTTMQADINAFQSTYDAAYSAYLSCVANASSGGSTVTAGGAMTSGKSLTSITSTTYQTFTWDLNSSTDAASGSAPVPVTFSIQARYYSNSGYVGFEFKNPTIKLDNGTTVPYEAAGLHLYLDGQFQPNLTYYKDSYAYATSTTAVPLIITSSSSYIVYSAAALSTKISFQLDRVSSNIGGGLTPGGTVPTPPGG
jgi:hypothetical protein